MAATKNNSGSGSTRGSRGASAAGAFGGEAFESGGGPAVAAGISINSSSAGGAGGAYPPAHPGPSPCSPSLHSSPAETVKALSQDVLGNMSRNGKNPKLDLRLNLSAHRGGPSGVAGNGGRNGGNNSNANAQRNNSPHRSSSSSPTSPPSSCVSSETEQGRCSSSPEATSMVLVGCPRCLMYVMLSEDDPKCPKCKSTVLLDFLNDPKNAAATSTTKPRKK